LSEGEKLKIMMFLGESQKMADPTHPGSKMFDPDPSLD